MPRADRYGKIWIREFALSKLHGIFLKGRLIRRNKLLIVIAQRRIVIAQRLYRYMMKLMHRRILRAHPEQ